jgi:hypothetical protein
VKPPKGTPVKTVKQPDGTKKGSGSGSEDTSRQQTGGDLSGDPFKGSGTVPDKK